MIVILTVTFGKVVFIILLSFVVFMALVWGFRDDFKE